MLFSITTDNILYTDKNRNFVDHINGMQRHGNEISDQIDEDRFLSYNAASRKTLSSCIMKPFTHRLLQASLSD